MNVSATQNAGASAAVGVLLSGVSADWVLSISQPTPELYSGWSPWSSDHSSGSPGPATAWGNQFKVAAGGVTTTFGANTVAPEGGAAALLAPVTVTGFTEYVFWIEDTAGTGDNRGGVSLLVTKVTA